MKPSVQVRKDHRIGNKSSQAQQSRNGSTPQDPDAKAWQEHLEKEFGKPTPGVSRGSCLAFIDLNDMAPVAKIKLTDDEWHDIYMMNMEERGSENFVTQAIREKLTGMPLRTLADELNQAVLQNNVLSELIENRLDYMEHRGDDSSGLSADDFNFGLWGLCRSTRDRLKKASDAIMSQACPKKVEAA